ncbi:MAG: leucine-rich repeat protein [Bacteroidales bacterium]|nr:leucine-rich repeat protein [Bacteroidales bacterium]
MKKYVMLGCALVLSVMAFAHDFEVDGFYYTRQSANTVNISFKGSNYSSSMAYSGDVVVPDQVEFDGVTYTVVGVDDGTFNYCRELTSVVLPNTVTTLGNYVFSYDNNLTSIILGSPSSIGNNNFEGCTSLASIVIYSSTVPSYGTKPFIGISDKSSITIKIPAGTKAAYEADEIWNGFIFEELPAEGGEEGGNEGGEEGGQEGGEEGGQDDNPQSAVSSLTNNFNISVSGNVISASQVVMVYNVLGGFEGKGYSVTVPKNGIYFVTAGNKSYKIYVK